MRTASFAFAGLLASATFALAPSSALAQRAGRQPVSSSTSSGSLFDITPYAGYMVFGNYLSGPLGTSLNNAPAAIAGVQVGMKISQNLSMIGNIAGGNSDIQVGVPFFGGVSVAHSTVLVYDAGLQLDIPMTTAYGTTLSPFVQAGVGAFHYDINQSFLNTNATNLAGNIGVGADIAMGKSVGLRLMAKDYIGQFNFQDATSFDVNAGTTQNFAFTAGVKFSF
ncbi:MAG: hypothetical protein ABJE47_20040 [bacterium]